MVNYDVFNGDADGICALIQLRLAQPLASELVTGVKRDTQLLKNLPVDAKGCITVLDVSLQSNRADVERLLQQGASIFYCDHHEAGTAFSHPQLTTLINTHSDVCTSLLINGYLQGRFADWAVVGAFGDNLQQSAWTLAKSIGLTMEQTERLQTLGVCLNYNAYGNALEDLFFHPAQLYQYFAAYESPLECLAQQSDIIAQLQQGYESDLEQALALKPHYENKQQAVYVLPNQAYARRVSGVFANILANQFPHHAHAVLTDLGDGYQVSVRAPLLNKQGAVVVCRQFTTGGGREAAAGINHLPYAELSRLIAAMSEYYGAD